MLTTFTYSFSAVLLENFSIFYNDEETNLGLVAMKDFKKKWRIFDLNARVTLVCFYSPFICMYDLFCSLISFSLSLSLILFFRATFLSEGLNCYSGVWTFNRTTLSYQEKKLGYGIIGNWLG